MENRLKPPLLHSGNKFEWKTEKFVATKFRSIVEITNNCRIPSLKKKKKTKLRGVVRKRTISTE
jgi:hydroxylamine reductase (hybrid-cluster protein)